MKPLMERIFFTGTEVCLRGILSVLRGWAWGDRAISRRVKARPAGLKFLTTMDTKVFSQWTQWLLIRFLLIRLPFEGHNVFASQTCLARAGGAHCAPQT